jgi:hypothetical protein
MITGRLHWKARGAKVSGKAGLAAFDFPTGTLTLTESGSKKRAALYLVQGEDGLAALDPGGLEVLETDLDAFRIALLAGKPHPETFLDGPAPPERHRQRLVRRDPSPGEAVPPPIDPESHAGGDGNPVPSLPGGAEGVDRTPSGRGWRRVSGERDRLPSRPWPCTAASASPAPSAAPPCSARVRRQRSQLLPDLPDRRPVARRPGFSRG